MIGHPPPILFHIGSVNVHTYGVVMALAILVAWLWAERRAKSAAILPALINDVFFWAVISGLVGARLGFVIQELSYYHTHWQEAVALWQGGLSFHGALVGGIIGGYLALRSRKATGLFWHLADAASAPLLAAAAIGRLGNWANQELYGYPTTHPWGIAIDAAHRLPGYEQSASFHPTFAYEAILNLLGVMILIFLLERRRILEIRNLKLEIGESFLFAIGWYGLTRGITEIWRIGDRVVGPFSLAQIISFLMILGAIGLIRYGSSLTKTKS